MRRVWLPHCSVQQATCSLPGPGSSPHSPHPHVAAQPSSPTTAAHAPPPLAGWQSSSCRAGSCWALLGPSPEWTPADASSRPRCSWVASLAAAVAAAARPAAAAAVVQASRSARCLMMQVWAGKESAGFGAAVGMQAALPNPRRCLLTAARLGRLASGWQPGRKATHLGLAAATGTAILTPHIIVQASGAGSVTAEPRPRCEVWVGGQEASWAAGQHLTVPQQCCAPARPSPPLHHHHRLP